MCTSNELDGIIKKIAEIYQMVYGEKLIKVILYGSYARGDYNNEKTFARIWYPTKYRFGGVL